MTEAGFMQEIINPVTIQTGLAMIAFGMAFTYRQKEYIRERDQHRCNAPVPHNCNGHVGMPKETRRLHVHHIIPQRYAETLGINPDFVDNGITLCENFHQEQVHPDMKHARGQYRGNNNAFKDAFLERKEKLKEKQIYWNDTWDRLFHTRAIQNKQRAEKSGIVYDPTQDDGSKPLKKHERKGTIYKNLVQQAA